MNEWLKVLVKSPPSISLVGQRQTGKTTLFKEYAKSVYLLDKIETLRMFEVAVGEILERGPFPILIDEIKGLIDERRVPRRYLLTGSVRFGSKKSIRESLTGRTLVLELLPMGIAETHSRPLSDAISILYLLEAEKAFAKLEYKCWVSQKEFGHFLESGGLPGICFHRDAKLRAELFDSHIDNAAVA